MRYLGLIAVLISAEAYSQTVEVLHSEEPCENYKQLIQDYIDLELAGARWQGGTSSCIKKLKLRTMASEKMKLPEDPTLADPQYILTEGREIQSEYKRTEENLLEVKVYYIGRAPGSKEDIQVKDTFKLKLNYGQTRDLRGCASVFTPLENLVMKKSCY